MLETDLASRGPGAGVLARDVPSPAGATRVAPMAPASRFALGTVAAAIAMMPLLRPIGPGNSAPDDILIVVALVATLVAAAVTHQRIRLPYAGPVAVLIFGGALAAMLHEPTTAAAVALGQDLLLVCFAAAIANAACNASALGALLRVWSLSATAWATILVGAVLTGNDSLAGITARTGSRASLTFGDANLAASYFVASLLIVAAAQTPRRRMLRWGAYLVLAAAVAVTGSLGGMLALLVAATLMAASSIARRVGVAAAMAVVLLVGPGLFLALRAGYDILAADARDRGSILHDSLGRLGDSRASRDLIIGEDLRLYASASLLGNGPTSTKSTLARDQAAYVKEAHNDYLATAIERGAIGVVGLLLLIGAVAQRARRAVTVARGPTVARAVPVVGALVAALVAVACSAVFYEVLHFRQVWALFGVVAAVGLLGER
jgi:O-Antigen ligase